MWSFLGSRQPTNESKDSMCEQCVQCNSMHSLHCIMLYSLKLLMLGQFSAIQLSTMYTLSREPFTSCCLFLCFSWALYVHTPHDICLSGTSGETKHGVKMYRTLILLLNCIGKLGVLYDICASRTCLLDNAGVVKRTHKIMLLSCTVSPAMLVWSATCPLVPTYEMSTIEKISCNS